VKHSNIKYNENSFTILALCVARPQREREREREREGEREARQTQRKAEIDGVVKYFIPLPIDRSSIFRLLPFTFSD
jgi:hypothetical protein